MKARRANQPPTECDLSQIDLLLDGEVTDEVATILDIHLADCLSCRDYMERTAADTKTWSNIENFLKPDSYDEEPFLSTSSSASDSRDVQTRIEQISSALAPSEFPNHMGRLGIYEITGVIGAGATGVVFKATDPSLDRTVAIKVLSPVLASSGAARKRFERESKAAAAVIHPNVIPIHGVSSRGQLSYLVMAFVGGDSLQNRLADRGPLKTEEVLRIGSQIAAGLAAAHDQGLVHRDIKPANIIMEDNVERVAITDFGLARAVDDASLTREGVIAGTPRYMSPEQSMGKSVTQQTDLFSLGSVLYAMATGRPPFRGETSYAVMRKICDEDPRPIRELNPSIPVWLEKTIDRLMDKDPDKRFQSAHQVSDLLERALAHTQQPTNVPLPNELKLLAQSKQPIYQRRKLMMIATLASILTAIGILATALTNGVLPQSFSSSSADYPAVALFENAKVKNDSGKRELHAFHDGQWFKVLSIADVSNDELFEFADANISERRVNKRVVEDLPVVFQMMDKPLTIPTKVMLQAKDGSTIKINLTPNEANRKILINAQANDEQDLRALTSARTQLNASLFADAMVKSDTNGRYLKVLHEKQWYRVLKIGDVTTEALFEFADKNLQPDDVNRRIIEDLNRIFYSMNKELPAITSVLLQEEDGTIVNYDIAATRKKRERLMKAHKNRTMDSEEFQEDVREFQKNLEGRFAYLRANQVDLEQLCTDLIKRFPNGLRPSQLAGELDTIMASFIDGHASVSHNSEEGTPQRMPFLIEPIGDRFVAFFDNRESFVDSEFPYITKIDGLPIRQFIEPFGARVAQGSPQYRLRNKLRAARDIGLARELSKLANDSPLQVELANEIGTTKSLILNVSRNQPIYGSWPRTKTSKVLENNIGYLRIPSMDSKAAEEIRKWMPKFSETHGLIVDVRNNGGGTREALIELARHLIPPSSEPRVANVCKYRLHERHEIDHLESRFAYRADSPKFGEPERAAIAKLAESFVPEWEPAIDEFSEWHYLVLSSNKNQTGQFYDKPVVILMNEKCFSATDIFLGAFKGWENVTLVGQPSGGGSAKSERFTLPNSDCRIRCASMASFQPNGKLYDGNGVQPDALVEPTPAYFLNGGKDPFMTAAMRLLNVPIGDRDNFRIE
jgi:serine/threonine protein kinase